jgi:hypothetical protein
MPSSSIATRSDSGRLAYPSRDLLPRAGGRECVVGLGSGVSAALVVSVREGPVRLAVSSASVGPWDLVAGVMVDVDAAVAYFKDTVGFTAVDGRAVLTVGLCFFGAVLGRAKGSSRRGGSSVVDWAYFSRKAALPGSRTGTSMLRRLLAMFGVLRRRVGSENVFSLWLNGATPIDAWRVKGAGLGWK